MVSLELSKEKIPATILRPIQKSITFGALSLMAYLLVVVVTTPSLSSLDAVRIAFQVNWWVIAGMSVGVGVQTFLITYAKGKGCNLRMKIPLAGTSGLSSAFSSFLSFFALVPVGCCGTWLYILSFIPGVLGTGASGFLINYSKILVVVGFVLMGVSITYTYLLITRRVKRLPRPEHK